jgi:hypothetical protein
LRAKQLLKSLRWSADSANSASSGEELMRIGFYLAYGLNHHSELWAYAMQPLL